MENKKYEFSVIVNSNNDDIDPHQFAREMYDLLDKSYYVESVTYNERKGEA